MKNIWTITRRELKAYFVTPVAYIYITTFLVLVHWLFFRGFFLMGQASLRTFFALMPWIFLFFVPAVAMSKWAEEKKTGTLELLFTFPIREYEAVAGKFLAGFFLLASALLLTLPLPATVWFLGPLDWGPVIGGYLGLLFMGGAYLAIGLWVSALTENQIVAFILGVVFSFALFILGEPIVTATLPAFAVGFVQTLGLGSHFESIGRGVLDSRDILYYLSVIGFFLFLNFKTLEKRS